MIEEKDAKIAAQKNKLSSIKEELISYKKEADTK